MILFQYSSLISSVFKVVGLIPAQLNMWSILPYFAITSSTKRFTESVEDTSNAEVRCSCFEEVKQRVWVSVKEEGFTSCNAQVPPREESFIAVARPIPDPAPVRRMILFSKEGAMVDVTCVRACDGTLDLRNERRF